MGLVKRVCKVCMKENRKHSGFVAGWRSGDDDDWTSGIVFCGSKNGNPRIADVDKVPSWCGYREDHLIVCSQEKEEITVKIEEQRREQVKKMRKEIFGKKMISSRDKAAPKELYTEHGIIDVNDIFDESIVNKRMRAEGRLEESNKGNDSPWKNYGV